MNANAETLGEPRNGRRMSRSTLGKTTGRGSHPSSVTIAEEKGIRKRIVGQKGEERPDRVPKEGDKAEEVTEEGAGNGIGKKGKNRLRARRNRTLHGWPC